MNVRIKLYQVKDEVLIREGYNVPKNSGYWYCLKSITLSENEKLIGEPVKTAKEVLNLLDELVSALQGKNELDLSQITEIKKRLGTIEEYINKKGKNDKIVEIATATIATAAAIDIGKELYKFVSTIKKAFKEGKSEKDFVVKQKELIRTKSDLTDKDINLSIKIEGTKERVFCGDLKETKQKSEEETSYCFINDGFTKWEGIAAIYEFYFKIYFSESGHSRLTLIERHIDWLPAFLPGFVSGSDKKNLNITIPQDGATIDSFVFSLPAKIIPECSHCKRGQEYARPEGNLEITYKGVDSFGKSINFKQRLTLDQIFFVFVE